MKRGRAPGVEAEANHSSPGYQEEEVGGRSPACPPQEAAAVVEERRGLTDAPQPLAPRVEAELMAVTLTSRYKKPGVCCSWV